MSRQTTVTEKEKIAVLKAALDLSEATGFSVQSILQQFHGCEENIFLAILELPTVSERRKQNNII